MSTSTAPIASHDLLEKHASHTPSSKAPMDSPDLLEKHTSPAPSTHDDTKPAKVPKTRAFWLVIISIMVTVFLSAIDLTGVSTALPTIAADLKMTSGFSWIGSAYAIASTAFMPLFGSMAMIFGRRKMLITSILFFALGSALSGAAQNAQMIIAARTIQGVGGGGILSLSEIVITDLTAQHERGLYFGLMGSVWALASIIGPQIGGALAGADWRWLFYLNLPLCGIALVLVSIFLNFKVPEATLREKLQKIDWANIVFVASIVLVLLGLAQGGNGWAWRDWRTIFTIVFGACLFPIWMWLEKKVIKTPTAPWAMFSNRTTLASQLMVFLHGVVMLITVYYLPVFVQSTKTSSPIISGLFIGPLSLTIAPFAIIAGILVQITQKYRILLYVGWALVLLGVGLFTLISSTLPTGQWVGFQILLGVGAGLLYTAPTFSMLAPLEPELHALGTALLNFQRSFGQAVGVTVGGVILSASLNANLPEDFKAMLPTTGGDAAYAAIPLIQDLPEPLRSSVRDAFGEALSLIFKVTIGFAALGLLLCLLVKELPLQVVKDERYALKDPAAEKITAAEVGVEPLA